MKPNVLQQQTEHAVTKTARRSLGEQLAAGSFQQLSIFNPGGTHLFAGPATETAIDVSFKCVRISLESPLAHCSHQVKPAAWPIVFITRSHVGGTGFQAQPAVNTGEQLLFFRG